MTTEILPQKSVYLIVRIPVVRVQSVRNSLLKNLSIHSNYKGSVIGITSEVQLIEGTWPKDKGIALLQFETMWDAQMWFNSVPDIKQQDWMDGVDIVAAPMTMCERTSINFFMDVFGRDFDVAKNKRFVQLLDIQFYDFERFNTEYACQASKMCENSGAKFGVISTDNTVNFRGLWDANYVVMNRFEDCDDFSKTYNNPEYEKLKKVRHETAKANVIVFELQDIRTLRNSTCQ